MQVHSRESARILRMAAWIWIGYLFAMAVMDFALYTQARPPLPPLVPSRPPLLPNPALAAQNTSLMPVVLYYAANGFMAAIFLTLAYWDWLQEQLGRAFYPLLLITISAAPIIINVLVVPRFPAGPLAGAEGMALRQLPVLFLALALVAWEYQLPQVIAFSIATTCLELGLIAAISLQFRGPLVLIFIAIIRTISFIALGVFINLLVARLREQQASLQQANANLTHYTSTLEQLTVSRERNRLARELHDTLAHSLSALSVTLETAKAYFEINPDKTRKLLDKSLETTHSGMEETRRALKALRSSALEDMGLGHAIRRLAESASTRFHLELELDLPGFMPFLGPDVEQCLYRVAQEAIENVAWHANAQKLTVTLSANGSGLELIVKDDGLGFDTQEKTYTGHFGLVGMRERAELAGGQLTIKSAKGKGTMVVLTI